MLVAMSGGPFEKIADRLGEPPPQLQHASPSWLSCPFRCETLVKYYSTKIHCCCRRR